MGLNASSDEWCRRSDEAVRGISNAQKIVDDILVCAATEPRTFYDSAVKIWTDVEI